MDRAGAGLYSREEKEGKGGYGWRTVLVSSLGPTDDGSHIEEV